MSKNVAVFVDVANIFYAAKAAGIDIDYVTLLKSATANRDFVRAYAYTGLDPENENQRQFHAFLARSGYKVVSKDIRKYGDGRVKANLDIELVVDMMRMAQDDDLQDIMDAMDDEFGGTELPLPGLSTHALLRGGLLGRSFAILREAPLTLAPLTARCDPAARASAARRNPAV